MTDYICFTVWDFHIILALLISPKCIFMFSFFPNGFLFASDLEFDREDAYTYTYILYRLHTSFCLCTIINNFPTESVQIPIASGPSNPIAGRKIRQNLIQPLTLCMVIMV